MKAKLDQYNQIIFATESELKKYKVEVEKTIQAMESELNSHKSERDKFLAAIGIQCDELIPPTKKKDQVQKIWEPSEADLLPNNLKECHELIITLRKVVRLHVGS